MITREQIVAEARTWLGTRYEHQGCVKSVGTDCLGLIRGVADALGLLKEHDFEWGRLPEYHGYGHQPNQYKVIEGCERFLTRIPAYDAQPGDIVIISFGKGPQHFAFLTQINPYYMLHSYAPNRKVVEHGMDLDWQRKVVACYRFPGIAD